MRSAGLLLLLLAAGLAAWFGPQASLGAVLYVVDPPLLNTIQAGVQRRIWPGLWDHVLLPLLVQPAWLVPLLLGGLLFTLGLSRRRDG